MAGEIGERPRDDAADAGARRARSGRRPQAALLAFLGAIAASVACHDSSAPSPSAVYSLAIGAGDLQLTPAGAHVAEPVAVRVTDASSAPVKGVAVRFRLVAGAGATLDDSAAVTGADGIARVELTVGPTPLDTVKVFAFVPGQENRGVTLRVVPVAPPTLGSVLPTTFTAGDTILLGGTHLTDPATTPTQVLFGTIAGRVIDLVAGGGGGLRVIVPPCVTAGAVQVKLVAGSSPATTVTGTYVAGPAVAIAPLDGTTIPAANVAGCVSLPGNGARYLLVPNFPLGTSRTPTSFVLGAAGTLALALEEARVAAARSTRGGLRERFDYALRAQGQELAPTAAANARTGDRGLALAALTLGSTRTFRVYGNLNGTVFKSTTATLKFVGANVAVYLDNDAPGAGFTDDEVQKFGALFDETLYGIDVAAFGAESDVDRNGHVIMLLSARVNELTPNDPDVCSQGIIVGFFTSYDLASKSTNSNQGEVFYSVVPDPQGTRGCPISLTRARSLIPATFVHEFQHMISYNQHVLARGGPSESIWVDEGMSHIAEELGSRHYEDKYPAPSGRTDPNQLFPDSSQSFILGDLQNAFLYMNQSTTSSVTNFTEAGSLDERGGAWLFLRWLADQKGAGVLTRIVQSGDTGKTNVARKTGEDFARLFGDFSIALYTDSIPGVARTAVPQRYRFTSRNLRRIFARLYSLNAPDITAEYPIEPKPVPLNGNVIDAMPGGTMDFFSLTTPAGSANVSLQFQQYTPAAGTTPATIGPFAASLGAQLGIFRLPPAAAAGP